MLVKDLIERLQELDPNLEVYLTSDDECNDVRKASCLPSEESVIYGTNDYYVDLIAQEDLEYHKENGENLKKVCLI
jgi:hypothetical protein